MKTYIAFITLLLTSFIVAGQIVQDPVKWSYSSLKTGSNTYKIIVRAKIEKGWHIYAQQQPKGAISVPTSLDFSYPMNVKLLGRPIEKGTKETQIDDVLDITQYYYSSQVDFIQTISISGSGASKITCKVSYMACNEQMCLPVRNFTFNIPIAGKSL